MNNEAEVEAGLCGDVLYVCSITGSVTRTAWEGAPTAGIQAGSSGA